MNAQLLSFTDVIGLLHFGPLRSLKNIDSNRSKIVVAEWHQFLFTLFEFFGLTKIQTKLTAVVENIFFPYFSHNILFIWMV